MLTPRRMVLEWYLCYVGGYELCNVLIQRINNGVVKGVSDAYAKQIDLYSLLKEFLLLLLSQK